MQINTYQPNSTPSPNLLRLLESKYGNSKNIHYFLNDYKKAFAFCINNENITFVPISLSEDGKFQGHVALIIDKRLPVEEAFFGFFEAPDNVSLFTSLWSSLTEEAKKRNISVLKGPVNGSIWHQYRCIKETDKSEFFKSELFSESYYYDFLSSRKPSSEIMYHSGHREKFDAILQAGQPAFDKLSLIGIDVQEVEPGSIEILSTIASISRNVFKNSWGYVELNQKEFLRLYSSDKLTANTTRIYLLTKNDQIIGFCGAFKEDDKTLICKTIAILPEYQGMGLGNALAFKVHKDARERGVKKIIYALIRDGNNIKNFPKEDALVFRRYAAFEFQI